MSGLVLDFAKPWPGEMVKLKRHLWLEKLMERRSDRETEEMCEEIRAAKVDLLVPVAEATPRSRWPLRG